jgi:hypothetical protein
LKNILILFIGLFLLQYNTRSQVLFHYTVEAEEEQALSIIEVKIDGEWVDACCDHFNAKGTFRCQDKCNSKATSIQSSESMTKAVVLNDKVLEGIKWYRMHESGESEVHVYEYKNGQLYADGEIFHSLKQGITAMEIELRDMKGLYARIGNAAE